MAASNRLTFFFPWNLKFSEILILDLLCSISFNLPENKPVVCVCGTSGGGVEVPFYRILQNTRERLSVLRFLCLDSEEGSLNQLKFSISATEQHEGYHFCMVWECNGDVFLVFGIWYCKRKYVWSTLVSMHVLIAARTADPSLLFLFNYFSF